MKHVRLAVFLLLPALVWASPRGGPPKDGTNSVELNGHTFTLPAGFTIELAAGPPLVERPIAIDFDEQGRLYVTESSGSNEKVEIQLKKKPHSVLRLEATKGDGIFDKRTIFANNMMLPEGVMCYQGSVFVAAPPSIWKLTDTTGSGVADQRVEWFQGKTLTGCANDLHGPYLGPDGWIYWCKGAFANQTYELPGKGRFTTRAAHIFRARPDGSGVEPVMTGGMDNPVDVVFTPGGERIFTTTFLQYPGGGKRDGLIHAVYGGIYGKEHHDVIDAHLWTGPSVMPVMTHLGAAAPSGLHRYESEAFGKAYKDNLFACLFNMQKVTRHILIPDGSTFKTEDSDFLVSSNKDFHPTDVIEDADGSLLVVDTGGWYKLCCPTSQLVKPAAIGAIYRVRKQTMPKVADPRGLELKWAEMPVSELAKLLGDNRPFVRKRAVQALADRGGEALPAIAKALDEKESALTRLNAIWAATRIQGEAARDVVRLALGDSDETVRQAALHSVSVWRDEEAFQHLYRLLALDRLQKLDSLQNRRAAAECFGRLGNVRAIPKLLMTLNSGSDRALDHSLIYAFMEIADQFLRDGGDPKVFKEFVPGPAGSSVPARRAVLIALSQLPGMNIDPDQVAKELTSPDSRMKEAAWWIAGRHPEWGSAVAGILHDRLAAIALPSAEQNALANHLAQFARGGPVQKLLDEQLTDANSSRDAQLTVLRAMSQSGVKQLPAIWTTGLNRMLASTDIGLVKEAINTARVWREPKQKSEGLAAALIAIGNKVEAPVTVRLSALAAVAGGLAKVERGQLELLLANLAADRPVVLRSAAAEALGRSKLEKEQLRALAAALKAVGPMELDRVLGAFAGCSDDTVGKDLIAALQTAPAKSSLRAEMLKPRMTKFGPGVQKEAQALYASLNVDAGTQAAHLENLLKTLPAGDAGKGHLVFNSQKAACFSCHAIGYRGGNVGPDLTHIARTRTERDLLEAIVFPNASFVRGFEPFQVTTKDGRVLHGVLRRDAPDEVVLAMGADREARITRDDIDDMRPSQVSVMPTGFDQLLGIGELADLLAFMKACK